MAAELDVDLVVVADSVVDIMEEEGITIAMVGGAAGVGVFTVVPHRLLADLKQW